MPTAPQVVLAFDDVAPRVGAVAYGDYTNDATPTLRVALGDQAEAGQMLSVSSDRGLATNPIALTAQQVAQGYVDIPVSGLADGFNLLSAELRRGDGSTITSAAFFALGVATTAPPAPMIVGAVDDVSPDTGAIAAGGHTNDATPTIQITEQGLPPAPQGSPGHAPYGGPALFGGRLQLFEGGHLVAETPLGYDGVVSLTPDALTPGEHVFTAVAVDRAGNVSATSDGFRIYVDPGSSPSNRPTNGDDGLQASAGALEINGGPGDDTITGAAAADILRGGPGNDSIIGGSGFNAINGNQGDDSIVGRSTVGDWLLGGQGDDLIDARGSTGSNIVNGNIGNDSIFGGEGGSILRGGQGDDVIVGGGGADWIAGDMGENTLTGGGGADTFIAFPGRHIDHVTDFDAAAGDRVLILRGEAFTATQVGGDTVVRVGGQGEMILTGFPTRALGAVGSSRRERGTEW